MRMIPLLTILSCAPARRLLYPDAVSPTPEDLRRYLDNYLTEREGAALYSALADAEGDPDRAGIFRKLAAAEERHCRRWSGLLEAAGQPAPSYSPGWRVHLLAFLARRFGTGYVLPVIGSIESAGQSEYTGQSEAAGMPAQERAHRRAIQAMRGSGGAGSDAILTAERWHRTSYGGSLRAAVFGMNDGLVSNFSLVMGVAGAAAGSEFILLAGVAGLLAGAFSMAAGEYVSVKSQRELYEQQIAREQQGLEMSPLGERDELALICQAEGIPEAQAVALADQIISDPAQAIQTLAREELGLDPGSLGSPGAAAASSFFAFSAGAAVPVVAFLVFSGTAALVLAALLSAAALFGAGVLISIFTGRNALFSGSRMLVIGALAATVTHLVGRLVGIGLG
jgi:VIT1/CCC1 family predicted Fe2+/Mn2+ transporter